tara:strand:+ start:1083 stop:1391 length:309 start_codon:yes stop_codon:yes gene_type:complete
MKEEIKQRLKKNENWQRGLYMLFFIVIYGFSKFFVIAVMVFQVFTIILTGKKNEQLLKLGLNLNTYIYQIGIFLTFNTEDHPFPFSDWPNRKLDQTDGYLEE